MVAVILMIIGGIFFLAANLPIPMNIIARMFSTILGVIIALIGLFFI